MNIEQAKALFKNVQNDVALQEANAKKLVAAMQFLGERHICANPVDKLAVPMKY